MLIHYYIHYYRKLWLYWCVCCVVMAHTKEMCLWHRFGEGWSGGAHLCGSLQLRSCQPLPQTAETHTRPPHEWLFLLPGEPSLCVCLCCYSYCCLGVKEGRNCVLKDFNPDWVNPFRQNVSAVLFQLQLILSHEPQLTFNQRTWKCSKRAVINIHRPYKEQDSLRCKI